MATYYGAPAAQKVTSLLKGHIQIAVYDHILHMSDVLTEGIVKQLPDRFRT